MPPKKKLKLCHVREGGAAARARAIREGAVGVKNAADGNTRAHLSLMAAMSAEGGCAVSERCGEMDPSTLPAPSGVEAEDDRDVYDVAGDGVLEFFDLLKGTAREDVQLIDARLRALNCESAAAAAASVAGGNFPSKGTQRIYEVASSLVNVSPERVELGKSLQRLAA